MRFKGITIIDEELHSFDDLGLLMLGGPEVSPPEVQETYLKIPGRDGKLCLNTALDGKVHYLNRTYTVQFILSTTDFQTRYSNLLTLVHGKTLKISSDYDPEYYYEGEWKIVDPDYTSGVITLSGDVQPYKISLFDGSKSL